jgi:hypothetical protein
MFLAVVLFVPPFLGANNADADEIPPTTISESDHNCPKCNFAVYANSLSPLVFGLSLAAEGGASFSGWVRIRSGDVGAATAVYRNAKASNHLDPSFGLAGGARWYSAGKGNLRGFYTGLGLEYVYLAGGTNSYDWRMPMLVPQVDVGYRWVWGHFMMSAGGWIGYAYNLERQHTSKNTGETTNVEKLSVPAAELVLDLGYIF